ncbi:MAG: hypothetical protein CL530_04635 [Aequorivita sp.]|nr:hypothetical protein [Aequorivita sp.]|tara:strand:+ start:2393 stop:3493 length:1101 start_codon:yes stop_codon:yes gene_type:complete
MNYISTSPKKNSNILRLVYEKESINLSPEYQRNGEIWPLEKRQLLIDSILNDYDIPKLYFHVLTLEEKKKSGYEYAVIDGRQRIETIFKFIDGEFPLSEDFVFLPEPKLDAKGLYYKDIAEHYPKLKMVFESFEMPIVCVETDDLELIDDMFLRLNEAVPLNAAEKRNAIGGPLIQSIKKLGKHSFFKKKVKFSNKRYQHLEVAVRLLFIEHYLQQENKVYDTKKTFLDSLAKKYKKDKSLNAKSIEQAVSNILDELVSIFADKDALLRTQSIIPIYYLAVRSVQNTSDLSKISRPNLLNFRDDITRNKTIAEDDISKADYSLIEFDRMSLQGTNDASSIRERSRILLEYLDIDKKILDTKKPKLH